MNDFQIDYNIANKNVENKKENSQNDILKEATTKTSDLMNKQVGTDLWETIVKGV